MSRTRAESQAKASRGEEFSRKNGKSVGDPILDVSRRSEVGEEDLPQPQRRATRVPGSATPATTESFFVSVLRLFAAKIPRA